MKLTPDYIHKKLQGDLPGLHSHLKLAPSSRAKEIKAYENSQIEAKKSAVMILFFHEQEKLKIILIRRSIYVGIHAGQIAFPGGRYEDFDKTVENTAFREIEEEIGIARDKIRLLGRLTDIYVPPSNFLISVFVGYLSHRPTYIKNEREIAEIIEINFNDFLADDIICPRDFEIPTTNERIQALCYDLPNLALWGASAMVMSELIDVLKSK